MPIEGLAVNVGKLLHAIQENIYNKAFSYRETHITPADTWEEFMGLLDEKLVSFLHTGMVQVKQKRK